MSLDALTKQLGISAGTVSVEEQEINIELNIESDEDGVPVDTTEAPEAQILDAQEEETELDNTEEAQEDLEDAHEALEALAISIESYKSSGGLTAAIAEEKYQQLDLITRRWGSLRTSCPSVESFGMESSQLGATISLENTVVEAIKKFWQTIVDTVNKWIASFREWVAKTFNAGSRLKKRAEKIKKMIGDIKSDPSSKEAEGTIAAQVYMSKGSVVEGANDLNLIVAAALSKSVDAYRIFASSNETGTVKAAEAAQTKEGEFDMSGISRVMAVYSAVTHGGGGIAGSSAGQTLSVGKPLPGGRVFGITQMGTTVKFRSDVEGVGLAKKWINKIEGKLVSNVSKETLKKAKVKYLSSSDCNTVVDSVMAIATTIEGFKNKFAEREKVGKEITEFAKKQTTASKEAEGKNGALVKANIQIAQTFWSRLSQIDKAVLSAGLVVSNSLLNFVSASISKGKGEDKKEEPKKDGE